MGSNRSRLQASSSSELSDTGEADQTWYLTAEVNLLTKRCIQSEVSMFLRRPEFRERQIEDPPVNYAALFWPIHTSSRLDLGDLDSSYDRVPEVPESFDSAPVRGKKRKQLQAFPCRECASFFKSCGLEDEIQKICRHRARHPRPPTPKNWWYPGWISPPKENSEENKTKEGNPKSPKHKKKLDFD